MKGWAHFVNSIKAAKATYLILAVLGLVGIFIANKTVLVGVNTGIRLAIDVVLLVVVWTSSYFLAERLRVAIIRHKKADQ